MITKENGLRYAKLIHVSVDNGKTEQSNKFYIMEEQSDGRIKCEYGRVGKTSTTVYKSSHQWSKIYNEKTSSKKGYTDVTEMIAESVTDNSSTDAATGDDRVDLIPDSLVRKLIKDLMAFANKSIRQNYKVTQDSVTEKQVEDRTKEICFKTDGTIENETVKGAYEEGVWIGLTDAASEFEGN